MDTTTLYLFRGLPGAGKSTLCKMLPSLPRFEADDFFIGPDGVYRFDPTQLYAAHMQCQRRTEKALAAGQSVIVSNTFTMHKELKDYFGMAYGHGATVVVVNLFDAGLTDEQLAARNAHGVPVEAIARMRARWANVEGLTVDEFLVSLKG